MTIRPAPIIAIHSPLVSVTCTRMAVSVWLDSRQRKWPKKVACYIREAWT